MNTGKVIEILKILLRKFPKEVDEFTKQYVIKVLRKESKTMCSGWINSSFKIDDVSEMKECAFKEQEKELQKRAPMLFSCVTAVTLNPRNKRCKRKTDEGCMPSIINSVANLFYTRNRLMNFNPFVNMCILRRGQSQKETFDRFHKIGVCLSYSNLSPKLIELGKNFDVPVKNWMDSMQHSSRKSKKPSLNNLKKQGFQLSEHPLLLK